MQTDVFLFFLFEFYYGVSSGSLSFQKEYSHQAHWLSHSIEIFETAYPVLILRRSPLPGCFYWFAEGFGPFIVCRLDKCSLSIGFQEKIILFASISGIRYNLFVFKF